MVVVCLCSALAWDHARHIKGRREMPLKAPTEPTRDDWIFYALWRAVLKLHEWEKHRKSWIPEEARQRESLREKGDGSASEYLETVPRHTGKPKGRQETEGGGRGDGCGGTARGGPAKCKGGVAKDEGVV